MAASINDKIRQATTSGTRPSPAVLTGVKSIGASSIAVDSTTGWATETAVDFVIYSIDANNERVEGTQTEWIGIVNSSTTVNNLTLKAGTDQEYAIGSKVIATPTAAWGDDLVEAIAVEHNQDGTHSDITADTVTAGEFIVTGAGGAGGGWEVGLPAPDDVTNNGNRSYDLTFNTTDYTDLVSPGMRLRTTRTVAAPDQCADLEESSSQYFSRANGSLTGITSVTDDITCAAWVKMESYDSSPRYIMTMYDGSSGWLFRINSGGGVELAGRGSGSTEQVESYQSIPLNRWVHVAASINLSANEGATFIDGIEVPSAFTSGSATSWTTNGDLTIGGYSTDYWDGKLAQVGLFDAILSEATIQDIMTHGLDGSETNNIGAWSLDNDITDLNSNGNDLTANGGAVATDTDSPFGDGATSTTLDYGIITAASYSTNTTLTVQVPEGCTIPTTGGVSAVAYSTNSAPYGFVRDKGRWQIILTRSGTDDTLSAASTAWQASNYEIKIPTGEWSIGYDVFTTIALSSTSGTWVRVTLSSDGSTETDGLTTSLSVHDQTTGTGTTHGMEHSRFAYITTTSPTTHTLLGQLNNTSPSSFTLGDGDGYLSSITAECAYL